MRKLVFVATLCAALSAAEIKIGVVMPITGAIASYGQTALEGIKLANSIEPKLKNGDEIKLVVIDNKGDKVETATAATRLVVEDQVSAIIGAMTTGNTQQVLQVGDEKKVPVVAPAATADKLLDRVKFGARVTFKDSFQGTSFASYAFKNLGLKSAVLIVDQSTAYSLGLAKAFKKEFESAGGKVLKELKISGGDKDFKAVASQVLAANPDLVYAPFYYQEASLLVRQARQIGVKSIFASGDGVGQSTFVELAGDAAEGYLFTDVFDSLNPPTNKSKSFVSAYEKLRGDKNVPGFATLGADSYFLIVNAMNNCADPKDRDCVNSQIKKTMNFEGVSGFISIDEKGNAVRSMVVKEVKNAKFSFKDTIKP